MQHHIIDLWRNEPVQGDVREPGRPLLTSYLRPGNSAKPAVLVLPGGGYRYTSPREAEPIALRFMQAGYAAFVLDYSVAPLRHPQPLHDVALALAHIRRNHVEYGLDPQRLAVAGFSAGGHLAASIGVHWDKPWARPEGVAEGENRPNALILGYPVISSGEFAHQGSFESLLGDQAADPALRQLCSLEHQVGAQTPPSFLWHTLEDGAVPAENSLLFASALRRAGISFALHLFPWGGHGLALATTETADEPKQIEPVAAQWLGLAISWLDRVFSSAEK